MKLLRTLDVDMHPEPGRAPHVASGSGLLVVGCWAYVAIDDEFHVGAFDLSDPRSPGRLLRIQPGTLPVEHHARKERKPDLESLFLLDHELVGVPSGSAPNRVTGFSMSLAPDGSIGGDARSIDWSPLLRELDATIGGDLNVEGAVVHGSVAVLLLRSSRGGNAIATLDPARLADGIEAGRLTRDTMVDVTPVALPGIDGVPLGFTDASVLDDRILFSAAAEDTDDPYDDGPVAGSVVGELVGTTARLLTTLPADAGKVEGLDVAWRGATAVAWLVTDDDDAARPSRMYELELPDVTR